MNTTKLKVEIKTIGGSILFAFEKEDNTIKKTLEQAVSQGAYLRGAYLRGAYLREKLIDGKVDGSQYEGECACLIGSLGKGNMTCVDKVVKAIPYYVKGLQNMGEQWFLQIKVGDKPENSFFVRHAVKLIDYVLGSVSQ